MKIKNSAIITAAGSSQRMGTSQPKQLLRLKNKYIIEYTLDVFASCDCIDEIILVIRPADREIMCQIAKQYHKLIKVIDGGASRELSTWNGLNAVADSAQWVICHDGARPFVTEDIILTVLEKAHQTKAAICAVPVKDTIKFVDENGYVDYTPNREHLYQVQTPQVFEKDLLKDSYKHIFEDDIKVTDDSSLLEIVGHKVFVTKGDYDNIKITTREDLDLALGIIERRNS